MGDRWEGLGHDPGRIHEFFATCLPGCEPGGLVLSNERASPGEPPKSLDQVAALAVYEPSTRLVHILPPRNPTALSRFLYVFLEICL